MADIVTVGGGGGVADGIVGIVLIVMWVSIKIQMVTCLCLFKASHTLSGKKTVIWIRLDKTACVVLLQIIKVPCSGKLPQIGENTIFAEKICADCWLLLHQRMPHPQILWRKLLRIATNREIHKKFSPSKVSRYTVLRKKWSESWSCACIVWCERKKIFKANRKENGDLSIVEQTSCAVHFTSY